jgi:hypothetical protein
MISKLLFVVLLVPQSVLDSVAESGRIVGLADSPSQRLAPPPIIAPGAPPILSFRYFDGTDRGRFGDLGLMTDDAGH